MWNNFDEPGRWTHDISNAELGAWVRLLSLGSKAEKKGVICIPGGIGYTTDQICRLLKSDKGILDKWEAQGAIKTENGIIYIENWKDYQSEYDRQKGYRKGYNTKLQDEVTPKVTEREVRSKKLRSKELEKEKTKDTRVKVLIDYFFAKHLSERKTKIVISGGKDGDIFKELLKTWSEEELKIKIDQFMIYSDPWMTDKPYSVGMFKSQFNKLGLIETPGEKRFFSLNVTKTGEQK